MDLTKQTARDALVTAKLRANPITAAEHNMRARELLAQNGCLDARGRETSDETGFVIAQQRIRSEVLLLRLRARAEARQKR